MRKKYIVEMPGIEPGAFHMQSERSTTELHPRYMTIPYNYKKGTIENFGTLV